MYLGIDFSGGAAAWKERCSKPTVWLATVDPADGMRLIDLRSVQDLHGTGSPFERLVAHLHAGGFEAAGLDAPFSIPDPYGPPGGHAALLQAVETLPQAPDRPFPSGAALVGLAASTAPLRQAKPYRDTERVWTRRGINTRSTLWNGPRGGAPFTAACLTLLARAKRPIWPWSSGPGMLVEAFPAAQLRTWDLPFAGYGKPEQRLVRERILTGLARRVALPAHHRTTMLSSPDALDAVVAAFAAMAAHRAGPPTVVPPEGLIAVLDEADRFQPA